MDKKKMLHHIHPEDVVQLVFGALIFGIPAAYTQETWDLGTQLHFVNYLFLFLLSILLIALIIFHAGYNRHNIKTLEHLYTRRVLLSYMFIFLSCTTFLVLIGKAPWFIDPLLALQRTIIISVPASISGITADIIR
ncbi:MAG: DUF2391 family protein [bacterium]|nr:DUF2391 family protein [bacterium]